MNLVPPPPLRPGERMKQPEFHRLYERYPEDQKFELVGGVVYMASPLRLPHSKYASKIDWVLNQYELATPGVEVLQNATIILGAASEPQPDLGMRVLPEHGGRSQTTPQQYIKGPPELLVEVSHSTRALDLHAKRNDYKKGGVIEYLVLSVEDEEVHWFHFPDDQMIRPGRTGVSRSRIFPGLWLDTAALLRLDLRRVGQVLEQGIASKAHAAFVRRLARQAKKRS